MNKVTLIGLILIIASGLAGVGYAAVIPWQQSLYSNNTIETGSCSVNFVNGSSYMATNDDGATSNIIDPNAKGLWSWTSGTLTKSNWSPNGAPNSGRRNDSYNNCQTTISGSAQSLTLTMTRVYPGYYSSAACLITSSGDIPMQINSVEALPLTPTADATISFGGALDTVTNPHTKLLKNTPVMGAVYVNWINYNGTPGTLYTLTININANQWNSP